MNSGSEKAKKPSLPSLVSGADPFKTQTYKIINLPFADKYRLLRGVLDGPIVVRHSTLNPHVQLDPKDEK